MYRQNHYESLFYIVLPAAAAAALALLALLGDALGGNLTPLAFVGLSGAAMGLAFYHLTGRPAVRRRLRAPSPDALLQLYYAGLIGPSSTHDAFEYACCAAVAYALYGEFGAARAVLHAPEWRGVPAGVQARHFLVEALLCYLDTRRVREGLVFARKARRYGRMCVRFPRLHPALACYDACIAAGELLAGDCDGQCRTRLARRLWLLAPPVRAMAVWTLEVASTRAGDTARAAALAARRARLAPNCRGLRDPRAYLAEIA